MSYAIAYGRRLCTPVAYRLWPVVVTNSILGVPVYFISFLFAYGFRDVVSRAEHLTFLTWVAIFAIVAGLIAAALPAAARPGPPAAHRAAFGVLMSLALNSAVVGVGSIVSAAHKDEGSVSADFTTTTDFLVAAGLFVLTAALAAAALRVDRRSLRGRRE